MRVRWTLSLAALALLLGARPAVADDRFVAFQRDGTFFHAFYAELLAQHQAQTPAEGARAESDSTESPKAAMVAGGGVLVGIAAVFIASAGSGRDSFLPGNPLTPSDNGILLPPQDGPLAPTPGGPNPQGGLPPEGGILESPVTVTPEPVSMALLASGLAGLSGMQLRRRLRGR